MKGSYEVIVQSRRLQYKFVIRRNITIIKGNSATGKTTLLEMIQEYNDNGWESGVTIKSAKECVVLSGRFWQSDLKNISNSNIFSWLLQHSDENILIIADGAAFGPEMSRITNFIKHHPNISLYLPESFEWLLLSSKLLDDGHIIKLLANPANYVESSKFFSWEQFFTNELINLTKGTIWQYSKGKLNKVYLNKTNIEKIMVNVPIAALTEVKL